MSHELNLALALVGGLVLALGLVSDWLKQRGVSDVLVALVLGIAVGPAGLGLLDPMQWGERLILEEPARLAVGVGLMGAALRLPGRYVPVTWRSLSVLLVAGMAGMWLVSSVLVWAVLGLPVWTALLIGAIVTPTDPVVASSIVTGTVAEETLPGRIPCLMTAEAGLNDGLALPLVLLCVAHVGAAHEFSLVTFLTRDVLWEVGGAVVLGAAAGAGTARLLTAAERRGLIERAAYLAIIIALTLFTLGIVRLVGSDGLLAVFVAGLAFDHIAPMEEREDAGEIAATVDRFFSLPIFVLIGLILPWEAWADLGWRAPALAAAVLVLRRVPVVLAVHRFVEPLRSVGDALLVGWFGPIGIAATFYAALSLRETGLESVFTVGLLLVFASVVVQGLTATPLMRFYGRRCDTARSDDDSDSMLLARHGHRAIGSDSIES